MAFRLMVVVVGFSATSFAAQAADWIHWRGPLQTGFSADTGLPEHFEVTEEGKNGLIWKKPFGGRSAPLVLGGRIHTIGGYDMSQPTEGERLLCFNADTGEKIWEKRFNVYHTDIVSSRLGWTTLTADAETGTIYAHTTGGYLFAVDKDGKDLWSRQLTEEFGRVTGYGGRIVSPLFDSGLVVVGLPNSSWGDQARGNGRFVAFDGKTGEVVWWSSPTEDLKTTSIALRGTYYSNPVVAVIGGKRMMITGAADGCVHALNVRTGERLWSYPMAAGVVNPSPVVDGNMVYVGHGEENPEGGPIGRVACLDASKIDPKTKRPAVVWENKKLSKRFGLASPAIADGRLYMPDDASEIVCFNAKSGKLLWRVKYGTVARGAPLIADGKMYIFDVNAKLAIYKLKGDQEPEELENVAFRRENGAAGFVETHGTPIAVNGKLYFLTQDQLYCVGVAGGKAGVPSAKVAQETPFDAAAEPVSVRVFPAEVTTTAGKPASLTVEFLDANGRVLPKKEMTPGNWSLPLPPKAPTGAQPPALVGELKADGDKATFTPGKVPSQQGYVSVQFGEKLIARARVRVAPTLPYAQDFEKPPAGSVPGGWINTQAKYVIVEAEGGKYLKKVNTDPRPPIARANAYVTTPDAANYAIQCDVRATEVDGKLPDAGVVNSRYTLILDGKQSGNGKRTARIVTWEARPRLQKSVEFDWQPGVWYTLKLVAAAGDKTGKIQAKFWKKGDPEPAEWQLTLEDPSPNRNGAAALYGYVSNAVSEAKPGSEIHYDNLIITPTPNK